MKTMNESITEKNLYDYCKDNGLIVYEKKAGSTDGMLFSLKNGLKNGQYLCNVRFLDLLPGDDNDYVAFEVHPGIHTVNEYYPMVANYCQGISSELGVVQADYEHGDVFFKAEFPMTDTAVSYQTIDMVVQTAVDLLDTHYSALDALAHGYIPATKEALPLEQNDVKLFAPGDVDKIRFAAKALDNYFINDSNHNIVSYDGNHWLCQIFTSKEHYNLRADCNADGIVRIRIGYGLETIKVDEAYRRMVATLFCKESAKRKVGTLIMDDGCVYAQTQISLLDGPVTKAIMDHVEAILIRTLSMLHRDIALVSHGIIPEPNDGKNKDSRLKSLLDEMPDLFRHHDDDDAEDEHSKHSSFFERLFGSHDDDEDMSASEDDEETAIPS